MFTGIIEEIGNIQSIKSQGKTLDLEIAAKLILEDMHIGDSISVNGVCLTVTFFNTRSFTADVMPVTFQATNLAKLKAGDKVNLERAMAANGRFGGHVVSGHVDGVGKIVNKASAENAVIYTIEIPRPLMKYCIAKGSIALDGTSLTLVTCEDNLISVSLIPHTKEKSVLGFKNSGDIVNVECDILAKHHNSSHESTNYSKISHGFLEEHGFI